MGHCSPTYARPRPRSLVTTQRRSVDQVASRRGYTHARSRPCRASFVHAVLGRLVLAFLFAWALVSCGLSCDGDPHTSRSGNFEVVSKLGVGLSLGQYSLS